MNIAETAAGAQEHTQVSLMADTPQARQPSLRAATTFSRGRAKLAMCHVTKGSPHSQIRSMSAHLELPFCLAYE